MNSCPVSVVVLTKNEEANICRCLRSLRWADEIVVVDDASTDATVELAQKQGARVVNHRFESFAAQRNWALDQAALRNDWVLMLDADEVASEAFAHEVTCQLVDVPNHVVAFRTCRKTMMDGVWLKRSDSFPVWIMRLVRRGHARFEESGHGEIPVPELSGEIGTIREPFLHYAFSRGMDDWWNRHVRYAGREAIRELSRSSDANWNAVFSLDPSRRRRALRTIAGYLPARGLIRFLYQYVLRGGFRDGLAGFRFCRMMGCYETMIAIRKSELAVTRKSTKAI